MKKVIANIEVGEIKRLYNDLKLEFKCKKCGADLVLDMGNEGDYFSYPQIDDDDTTLYKYCGECDSEWNIPYKLLSATLTLDIDMGGIYED